MGKTFLDKVEDRKDLISAAIVAAVSCTPAILGNASLGSGVVALCGFVVAVLLVLVARVVKARRDADSRRLEQMLLSEKAKLQVQKAMSFDFKMAAALDSPSFNYLNSVWLTNCGVELTKMKIGDARFFNCLQSGYISAKDFLDPNSGWNSSFSISPMRNVDKKGKCIVQVSFIPIDQGGKIPIILRMPLWHSTDIFVEEVQKAKLTFVSFSPVPLAYGKLFDVADCYHREVPDRNILGVSRKFEELGMVAKREKDDKVYLFYVFAVKYSGCSFADEFGNLNYSIVNQLFAVDGNSASGDVEYFVKDHDKIVAVATATDIDYVVGSREHSENAPQWLKDLFANHDYVVETVDNVSGTRIFRDHFDMTTADLGGVEKKIIQKLMV